MWVEGLVDKEHVLLMEVAGFELDWKIEDEAQLQAAVDKGLDLPKEIDFSTDNYIRFYLDRDIEDFISPEELFSFVDRENLPLLTGIKNPKLAGLLEKALKMK